MIQCTKTSIFIQFTVLLCLSVVELDFAQGTWTPLENFQGSGRYGSASFSINNYYYVVSGLGSAGSNNEVWRFNRTTGAWEQKQPMNVPPRFFAAAFVVNGKGFVGTGNLQTYWNTDPLAATDFYEYNESTDQWIIRPSVGPIGRYGAIGFTIGDKGYIAFGARAGGNPNYPRIGTTVKSIFEYDNVSDTWINKNTPTLPGIILPQIFTINDKAYIAGGFQPGIEVNGPEFSYIEAATARNTWEYDPISNVLTTKSNMPVDHQRHAGVAFTLLDRGILAGGIIGYLSNIPGPCTSVDGCYVSSTIKYNPYIDQWSILSMTSDLGKVAFAISNTNCNYGYTTTGRAFDGTNVFYNVANYRYDDLIDQASYVFGPSLVCSSFDSQFNLQLAAPGSVIWSTSSNIYITSGQGTKTVYVRSSSNGSGWVKATYNDGCRDFIFQKSVWAGPYGSGNYPITGPNSVCKNQYVYVNTNELAEATNYNWLWPSSWTYVSGQGTRYLALRTTSTSTTGAVSVRVDNSCGFGGSYNNKVIVVNNCGSAMSVQAFPNPASNSLSVKISFSDFQEEENSNSNDEAFVVALFNDRNQKVIGEIFTSRSFQLPVENLPKGTYYLQVSNGDNLISKQILIRR